MQITVNNIFTNLCIFSFMTFILGLICSSIFIGSWQSRWYIQSSLWKRIPALDSQAFISGRHFISFTWEAESSTPKVHPHWHRRHICWRKSHTDETSRCYSKLLFNNAIEFSICFSVTIIINPNEFKVCIFEEG